MSLPINESDRSRKAQLLMLAEQGNADAQYELGMLYKLGDATTEPNIIAAQRWLKKAALQQHEQALNEMKKIMKASHLNKSAAIKFSHSTQSRQSRSIPNDQLREVTDLLKQSNHKNQIHKVMPKSNVHTPLSDIYRKIHDQPQQQLSIQEQSLPPTIRHLKQTKAKQQINTTDNIKTQIESEHFNALKILPSEIIYQLNDLIGLFEAKQFITKLSYKTYEAANNNKKHIEGFHTLLPNFLFTGNPGCGISTISHIIQEIFYHFKLISNKQITEINTEALTELKIPQINNYIDDVFEKATSGVLIINHLEKLCRLDNYKQGHIIIESLVRHNSRYTDKVMIIANCQRHNVSELTNLYSKLNILFQKTLEFNDLNPSELIEIYQLQLKNMNLNITAEALHYVNEIFQALYRTRGHVFQNTHLVSSSVIQHVDALHKRTQSNKNVTKNLLTLKDVEL
ncbi:AAA family ATPase [Thiotrichales bacterium 19S3-7]|nr:AAA family ATPase [Thiotrichales bacterium 19S3-7]MCF6802862.1 AAA family ATPase [Thiotrichales bacterium 19S3-11]